MRKTMRLARKARATRALGRFSAETSRALDLISDAASILDDLAEKFDAAGMNDIGDVYGNEAHKLGQMLKPLRKAQAAAKQRARRG